MSPGRTLSRRGWTVLALLAAVVAAVAVAPRATPSAELQLVALDSDGRFQDSVAVGHAAARMPRLPGAVSRVPLVLGVRNVGRDAARPERLELSVPDRVRLTASGGQELTAETAVGEALVKYVFEPRFRTVEPRRLPELLPGLDTLWVEVVIPTVYCVVLADSVPEYIPAATPDPETVARIRVFYAFDGGDIRRQTGVLTLDIDEALVRRERLDYQVSRERPGPAPPPPDTMGMERVESRTTMCGDPSAPVQLQATQWRRPEGGRIFVLAYRGTPRKHLYDLDEDGYVEREAWDMNGDGRMDRSRRTHFPVPEALAPRRGASAGS